MGLCEERVHRAFAHGMLHGMRTNVPVWVRNECIKYYRNLVLEKVPLQPIFVEKYLHYFKGNLHYFNKYRLKCLKCTY